MPTNVANNVKKGVHGWLPKTEILCNPSGSIKGFQRAFQTRVGLSIEQIGSTREFSKDRTPRLFPK